jgi:hypothetical protein
MAAGAEEQGGMGSATVLVPLLGLGLAGALGYSLSKRPGARRWSARARSRSSCSAVSALPRGAIDVPAASDTLSHVAAHPPQHLRKRITS